MISSSFVKGFHATTSISGRGIDLLFSATFSGFVTSTFTPIRVQKPWTSKNLAAITSNASMRRSLQLSNRFSHALNERFSIPNLLETVRSGVGPPEAMRVAKMLVDEAGGSCEVRAITDDVAEAARETILRNDTMGVNTVTVPNRWEDFARSLAPHAPTWSRTARRLGQPAQARAPRWLRQ